MHSIVTVASTTAEVVYDLTTVDFVNIELNLTSTTASDATVAAQITACSRIIADLCGRVFALQTVTETFRIGRHEHCRALPLARWPVVGTVSLTADDSALTEGTEFEIDTDAGMVWRIGHGHFHGKLVMNYSGGYDLPDDAPAGLARACVEIIREQRYAIGRNPGIRAVMAGENRVDYFDARTGSGSNNAAVSATVEGLISPFRRLAV